MRFSIFHKAFAFGHQRVAANLVRVVRSLMALSAKAIWPACNQGGKFAEGVESQTRLKSGDTKNSNLLTREHCTLYLSSCA